MRNAIPWLLLAAVLCVAAAHRTRSSMAADCVTTKALLLKSADGEHSVRFILRDSTLTLLRSGPEGRGTIEIELVPEEKDEARADTPSDKRGG